jgi:hypothetical protein
MQLETNTAAIRIVCEGCSLIAEFFEKTRHVADIARGAGWGVHPANGTFYCRHCRGVTNVDPSPPPPPSAPGEPEHRPKGSIQPERRLGTGDAENIIQRFFDRKIAGRLPEDLKGEAKWFYDCFKSKLSLNEGGFIWRTVFYVHDDHGERL